jgi:mono/diheme cytochrome c family protein
MAPVTTNLGDIADQDVRAIAVYVADRMGGATKPDSPPKAQSDNRPDAGKVLFDAACASCHDGSRPLPFGGIELRLSTAVHASDPTNIVNVILQGLPPASGERSPVMPSYHAVISDEQVVDLLAYMRSAFTDKPAWPDLPALVSRQRVKAGTMPIYAMDGNLSAPARPHEKVTSW